MGVNYINRTSNNSCDDAARAYVSGQGFWENLFSYGSIGKINKRIKKFKMKYVLYISLIMYLISVTILTAKAVILI